MCSTIYVNDRSCSTSCQNQLSYCFWSRLLHRFFIILFSFSNIDIIDAALSPNEKKSDRVGKFFWYYLTTTSTSIATSVSTTTTITGKTNQDINIRMKERFESVSSWLCIHLSLSDLAFEMNQMRIGNNLKKKQNLKVPSYEIGSGHAQC